MNKYTVQFKELSDSELAELLSDFDSLNNDAKEALCYIIYEKPTLQNEKFTLLKSEIESFNLKVDRLDYLRNLGFKAQIDGDTIKIIRSKSAITWDVFGVIIGIFFLISLISAVDNFKEISVSGIDGLLLLTFFVNAFLGILGFALFYKTANRLIEYKGFKIVKDHSSLTISKHGDLIVDSILSKNSLGLDVSDGGAVLFAGEDKKPLISSRGTPLFVKTLEEVYKKLSK
jgi:hypothetical protein